MNHPPDSRDTADTGVLSEHWEDVLQAGQAMAGEQGSLEDEIAIARLLRHSVRPEALDERALDSIWRSLEPEMVSVPWWRRIAVVRWTPLLAVAAAGLLVVIARSSTDGGVDASEGIIVARYPVGASAFEAQFERLAPRARERVTAEVDVKRAWLRAQLLAQAGVP